jgi:hypothetical protein
MRHKKSKWVCVWRGVWGGGGGGGTSFYARARMPYAHTCVLAAVTYRLYVALEMRLYTSTVTLSTARNPPPKKKKNSTWTQHAHAWQTRAHCWKQTVTHTSPTRDIRIKLTRISTPQLHTHHRPGTSHGGAPAAHAPTTWAPRPTKGAESRSRREPPCRTPLTQMRVWGVS